MPERARSQYVTCMVVYPLGIILPAFGVGLQRDVPERSLKGISFTEDWRN